MKLTREVASKLCVCLKRLATAVRHPKASTDHRTGKQQLQTCDAERKELERIEEQPISDHTKRTTSKRLIPADLQHDLERGSSLKT